MEIVKHIDTGVVIYAGPSFTLSESGLTSPDGLNAVSVTTKEYIKQSVNSIPDDFKGNHYTYNGSWAKTQAGIDKDNKKLEELKQQKRDELAALRYQKETSGFTLSDGTKIYTDDRAQFKLKNVYDRAKSDPNYTRKWKGKNGWVQLSNADIIALGDAIFGYIDALYDREEELSEAIELDINTDITTGWPGE